MCSSDRGCAASATPPAGSGQWNCSSEWVVPFLRAIERATTYLANHSDEAWELFKNTNPELLDNELNRRAWRDTLHRFALRPAALDTRRYVDFAQFLKTQGLIDTLPDIGSYAYEAH